MNDEQRDRAQFLLDEIVWLALFPDRDERHRFDYIKACRGELVELLKADAPEKLEGVLASLDRIIGVALFPGDRSLGMSAPDLLRVVVLRAQIEANLDG